MKRAITLIAAFAAVALLTVAAQAENKGEQVFNQKCAMCHAVKGKGGKIGPELTKISARLGEKDLRAKLENPKKANPATSMPAFKNLPKADLDLLIGYLKTLR
ncbi:c-type cytochrome [Pelotalea chapellei]|uniref:C-type cytochrome n=1 Tax=Pelotalea chapellei TaxID=44671 RepID=A0ABS5U681_9BACT|nr:cytochrome c [Pelotalea chapellei]MBT1071163.1 c-type cytochrome [Pelotalea chapellei]